MTGGVKLKSADRNVYCIPFFSYLSQTKYCASENLQIHYIEHKIIEWAEQKLKIDIPPSSNNKEKTKKKKRRRRWRRKKRIERIKKKKRRGKRQRKEREGEEEEKEEEEEKIEGEKDKSITYQNPCINSRQAPQSWKWQFFAGYLAQSL